MTRLRAGCGTISGYHRHRRAGEQACEACKEAWAIYGYDRTMVRSRALSRLARENPERFGELMKQEAKAFAAEQKLLDGPDE